MIVMRNLALLLALALAACAERSQSPPLRAGISGPVFPASRFECGTRPLPPNPVTVGRAGGSAAIGYEGRLGTWGQHCANQLGAIGATLRAAGQVEGAR